MGQTAELRKSLFVWVCCCKASLKGVWANASLLVLQPCPAFGMLPWRTAEVGKVCSCCLTTSMKHPDYLVFSAVLCSCSFCSLFAEGEQWVLPGLA